MAASTNLAEEIDFCWRLINLGKKIFYTGKSTIYHVGGGTLNKQNPRKTFLNIRNNLSMLVKNLPFGALFWIIPLRLALDVVAGIYLAYKEGISHLWAVFKGHLGFYTQFPESFRRRVKNLSSTGTPPQQSRNSPGKYHDR